jgi:hypothetical protein
VCESPIDRDQVSIALTFRCPHCRELLRERRPATGWFGMFVWYGGMTLLWVTGTLGWLGFVLVPVGYIVLIAIVHAFTVWVFGYTLEPVAEGGRLPLGEADESETDE